MKLSPGLENPPFEFIGWTLLSVIAHPCNCAACTMHRQNAAASLMWLVGMHTNADVRFDAESGLLSMKGSFAGEMPLHGSSLSESQRATFDELARLTKPDSPESLAVIVSWAQKRLNDPAIPIEERAQLEGWLSRIAQ